MPKSQWPSSIRPGARVEVPDGNVAADYVGLLLEHQGTTLKDVYESRMLVEAPCAALLACRRTDDDLVRLRAAVAEAEPLITDPSAFIRVQTEFHALVLRMAGNRTLAVVNSMVRHIIDRANFSHVDLDAGSPENVRANKRGFRAHVRLVELVSARQGEAAEKLWRLHLREAEDYVLQNRSTTTVFELFSRT